MCEISAWDFEIEAAVLDSRILIDYKTDKVSRAEIANRMTRYSQQGEAYRVALEEATKLPVPMVTFVFAHPREEAMVGPDPERRRKLLRSVSEL